MFTWIIMVKFSDGVLDMCRQLVMIPLTRFAVINFFIPQDLPMKCSADYPTFYLLPLKTPLVAMGPWLFPQSSLIHTYFGVSGHSWAGHGLS